MRLLTFLEEKIAVIVKEAQGCVVVFRGAHY
jgi:hypothetical protein